MKQIWISRVGPVDVLKLQERPDPTPLRREVRIRTRASGVNFSDILIRLGVYAESPPLPAVVGYEVSGVVDEVGAEVTSVKSGDRVIAFCSFGGYSDTVTVPESRVYQLPASFSFEEGAALTVNYLTAYLLLYEMARTREGEKVLIHSAAGGVGLAAIELCRLLGAEPIAVASATKHPFLRDRGVKRIADSKSADLHTELRTLLPDGVDVILDPLGPSSWPKSLKLLSPFGRLCIYGNSSIVAPSAANWKDNLAPGSAMENRHFELFQLINDNKGVMGTHVGRLWHSESVVTKVMNRLLEWCEAGKIRPFVGKVFPYEQVSKAHAFIQDRLSTGKVVLSFSQS